MQRLILHSILFLILTLNLIAANRYVDYTGGNDSNSGLTELLAWKTTAKLNANWSLINPGDSVKVKCGEVWLSSVIQPPANKSGTLSAYIVVCSYGTGAKPVIASASTSGSALYMDGNDYFVIRDIEFRGYMRIKATSSSFQNNKFLYCTMDGSYVGGGYIYLDISSTEIGDEVWSFGDVNNWEIGYCTIKNTSGNGISMYVGSGSYWFHHNTVYNTGTEASAINIGQGDNSILEYNIIYNSANGIKYQSQRGTSNNVIIRGNLIYNLTYAYGAGLSLKNLTNSQIHNNTIYSGSVSPWAMLVGWVHGNPIIFNGLGTYGFEGNIIANNMFNGAIDLCAADSVRLTYRYGTDIRYKHTLDSLKLLNTWTNNLYYPSTGTTIIRQEYYASGTWNYYDASCPTPNYCYILERTFPTVATTSNFYTNWDASEATITNEIYANPLFLNVGAYNFRIPDNSPAYEAGTDIVSYTVDLDGYTIYGVPSIGAYDHFTPPPPEVTGTRRALIRQWE